MRSAERPGVTSRLAIAVGALASAATASLYALGASRAYDYDSAESVGSFIATRSLLDPFRRQLQFNNHPLFSFVDHVVYTLGGHSEPALRAFPIAAGALTVGLVAFWAANRWGLLPALVAASLLAGSPTFAVLSRSVRGYSLLTLSAVTSTLLLVHVLNGTSRRLTAAYAVAAAVGIATHLYALLFVVGQIAAAAAARRIDRALLVAWLFAVTLGLTTYLALAGRMLAAISHERGSFQAAFPAHAAYAVLGSSPLAIVALSALTVLAALGSQRVEIVAACGAIAAALTLIWLSSPRDLYPRFLVWLIPAVALVGGASTRYSRWAVIAAAVALVAMIRVDAQFWTTDPVPSRQAARLVRTADKEGDHPCVLPGILGALLGYEAASREVSNARGMARCGLVLGAQFDPRALRAAARRTFRYRWSLPAETPYIVYSKEPPGRSHRVQGGER